MIRESRRAEFAGQALIDILPSVKDATPEGYAIWAYGLADAMLVEWEKEAGE
jgi:hypothetical protein